MTRSDQMESIVSAPHRKLLVGLIGGIGSGKSSVAAALEKYGGRIIDADQIGHQVLHQPSVRTRIVERWGQGVLDEKGAVDRRKLAGIVFTSPQERRALETLVHPLIGQAIRVAADRAISDPTCRFIVLDAAIMLEAGWSEVCDKLIFLETPREERLQRVARQRGWSEVELAERERAQMPLTEKAARADHVLQNTGTFEQLDHQVADLLRSWNLLEAKPGVSVHRDREPFQP